MTRTLSTPIQSSEQYATFTAAENIQEGDIIAIGTNDGKAYYLNDPAASDAIANSLRNFSLSPQTNPTQIKPVTSVATLPVLGTSNKGWAKTAQLSNGNTVIVFGPSNPATYAQSGSNGVTTVDLLNFLIIDSNGAQVVGQTTISTNWTAIGGLNSLQTGYFGPMVTGVTVIALPAGGFAVSYVDYIGTNVQLQFKSFSNTGAQTGSGNVNTYQSGGFASGTVPTYKMALLSNGNLVFVWAWGRYMAYNTSVGGSANYIYSHSFSIYTPTGASVFTNNGAGTQINGFYAQAYNNEGQIGLWVSVRPFSSKILTLPNGNWTIAGYQVDYGASVAGQVRRNLLIATYSSAGALVGSSTNALPGMAWSNSTNAYATTEGYVLGCVLSNGSALVLAGSYDGSANSLYSVSQTGVVQLLRSGLIGSLTAMDGGDSFLYGLVLTANAFWDQYPYGMYAFGTGALLMLNQNEQILSSTGATLATANNLGTTCRPTTALAYQRWAATPVVMTTPFGQVLTIQGLANYAIGGALLPIIPISANAFGVPLSVKISPLTDGYVKSFAPMVNPQNTGANCYQAVLWDGAGYANTYTIADAIQGMTFVGVAKKAAAANAPVTVQTAGQAKLRNALSQPMIIDTRYLLAPTAGRQAVTIQSNTFGTLATIFGDTATLKGNS